MIQYVRPDAARARRSDYQIVATDQPAALRALLGAALGEAVVVRKQRELYRAGQTRVHLDQVEGLGSFLELEVVLGPGQSPAEGHAAAAELMSVLGIDESMLIPCAYADLLGEGAGRSW